MGVRSEYQKHFKVSALRKSLPNYYENVAFRTARKEREYSHTPLSWYAESEETNSVDSDSSEDDKVTPNVSECTRDTVTESVTEPSNKDSHHAQPELRIVLKTDESADDKETEKCAISHVMSKVKTSAPTEQTSHSKKAIKSKTQIIKPGKPRWPERKLKIAPRPSSQGPSKHKSSRCQSAPLEHPAPFMSYGWGDVEQDLCQHKTFNVKATTDVYPAALRAQERRKIACQRKAAVTKKTSEDRIKAMLEIAAREKSREDLDWRSEYQRRFPAYDASEYVRSISARANDRRLEHRIVYVP